MRHHHTLVRHSQHCQKPQPYDERNWANCNTLITSDYTWDVKWSFAVIDQQHGDVLFTDHSVCPSMKLCLLTGMCNQDLQVQGHFTAMAVIWRCRYLSQPGLGQFIWGQSLCNGRPFTTTFGCFVHSYPTDHYEALHHSVSVAKSELGGAKSTSVHFTAACLLRTV